MTDILIIIATLVGLGVGGHFFVSNAAAIGQKCGLTPAVIGATIVAIGTSLPEWAISVFAASQGMTDLALGNVIGSNICNICIILGIAGLIAPLVVRRRALVGNALIMLGATALLLLFSADGAINRFEGLVLLVCGVMTVIAILKFGKEEVDPIVMFHWWQVPLAVVALVLVLVSSHFFVGAAKELAQELGVSPWVIGLTVAAIGTSLPELVTALAAAWQRHTEMVIGNIIGSNIMNIFFVLGSAASIHTLATPKFTLGQAGTFTVLMVVAIALLFTKERLERWEGAVLLVGGMGWYWLQIV